MEAWRLLGETTLLSQQASRSVTAYEKAVALSTDDLQVSELDYKFREGLAPKIPVISHLLDLSTPLRPVDKTLKYIDMVLHMVIKPSACEHHDSACSG